jgi:hypothetical protein
MLRFIDRFLIAWTEGARRLGLLVVLLSVIGGAFAGWWAFAHLKVNTDTSEMLDPDLPFQQNARALREAFPQIKTDLIVIVRAPTLDETEAFATDLRTRLLQRTDVIASVFAPAEEDFFRENGLLYLDVGDVERRLTQMSKAAGLIETLIKSPTADTLFQTLADNDELAEKSELGKETLQDIYAELAAVVEASVRGETRPFAWMGALDTDDPGEEGFLRLLYATPVLDFNRLNPARPALDAIHAEIETLEAEYAGRVDVLITGDPALRADELTSVTQGIGLSFLVSFFAVGLLLLFCYRSPALSAITLVALMLTLMLTSAFAALAVGELNLVSIAFTVLLVGLGLEFCIHPLLHLQVRRASGQNVTKATRGAFHDVGPGLVLAAMTTALGFYSFIPTKFDGIAQLGLIAGTGVLISLLVSVTFLPAAIRVFPAAARGRTFRVREPGGLIHRLTPPIAALAVLAGLAAVWFVPQARFDADPMSLRDPQSPSVQGFNLLFSDTDTIPYRLSLLVQDAAEAESASQKARALALVRSTRSLPDFVPDDQEEKLELIDFASATLLFALEAEPQSPAHNAGKGALALEQRLEAAYSEGPAVALAAQLEKLRADPEATARAQENIFRFWPQLIERLRAQLLASEIDMGSLPEALVTRYRSESGLWRVDILPAEDVRDRNALDRFVDAVSKVFPEAGGGALQSKRAGEVISNSMLQATSIAFAVVAIFLWLLVRRLTSVFLILFPLALAATLTVAAGVLLDIPFNYANVIVLPLLFGVGVDSGIHLVLRQQHQRHVEDVFTTATPRAVTFSAVSTIASFGSLMLSAHRGTASMGALLSIAIGFTLLTTLVVLPAAFRLMRKEA